MENRAEMVQRLVEGWVSSGPYSTIERGNEGKVDESKEVLLDVDHLGHRYV